MFLETIRGYASQVTTPRTCWRSDQFWFSLLFTPTYSRTTSLSQTARCSSATAFNHHLFPSLLPSASDWTGRRCRCHALATRSRLQSASPCPHPTASRPFSDQRALSLVTCDYKMTGRPAHWLSYNFCFSTIFVFSPYKLFSFMSPTFCLRD